MAGTQKQREELPSKLVALQMEIIGKTYEDAMNTPEFWKVFTMTELQLLDFKRRAIFIIQKTLKCNKKKANLALELFLKDLSLRIEE